MSNQLIKYQTQNGEVELSPQIIKQYLVNGDADKIDDQEIKLFMELCKYRQLNPFLKECHLIKFGKSPAQIVVSYDVFIARAELHEHYQGYESGVILINTHGEKAYQVGALRLPDEQVVGGWCEVYRDDYKKPIRIEVTYDEYVGKKYDGTVNRQWSEKPAFMITKVAEGQAHRKAFPNEFKGMYLEEENAPIINTVSSGDDSEVEILDNINKDQIMILFRVAKKDTDTDKAKSILCQACAELGLIDIDTKYEDLHLTEFPASEYPKILDQINDIKNR